MTVPLLALASSLRDGTVTSVGLIDAVFERLADDQGGGSVFVGVYPEQARAAAADSDRRIRAGAARSALEGIPISVKDIFDVAGEPTLAGAVRTRHQAPATTDAVVVQRLREAGAVIVGRTNMTEFALSGLGINPHHGTPRSPWHRWEQRIAGGSSSGAAVSVSDGFCAAALGTDTGGSVRIPAAFCGVSGFKPTAKRVPRDGTFPLSVSLDSIGTIAPTITCCAVIDRIVSGEILPGKRGLPKRFGICWPWIERDCDEEVLSAFKAAIDAIADAGAEIVDVDERIYDDAEALKQIGSFACIEGWLAHKDLFERIADVMDPFVWHRFSASADVPPSTLTDLKQARADLIAKTRTVSTGLDGIVMPTVPMLPPTLSSLHKEQTCLETNRRVLRNTLFANLIDGCAATIPCPAADGMPIGLMVTGNHMDDALVLAATTWIASVLDNGNGRAIPDVAG